LGPSLVEFLAERRALLRWLKSLGTPDRGAKVVTRFGALRDGGMSAAWAAHDQVRMRQLVELHRLWLVEHTKPHAVGHAGVW